MAIDSGAVLYYFLTIGKTLTWVILGGGLVVGVAYYLLIVKRRRVWLANIWEKKADGVLHLVSRDKVVERNFNKGKQVAYIMKNHKQEVLPPSWESVQRLWGKEYVDYLRIEGDLIPLSNEEVIADSQIELDFVKRIKGETKKIKKLPKQEVLDKYVFIPIHKALKLTTNYKTMDYDINMMRINAIDNRDKIYSDKRGFWEKYGLLVGVGLLIVGVIVISYLSYDYSTNVINIASGNAQATATAIQNLANNIGGVAPVS